MSGLLVQLCGLLMGGPDGNGHEAALGAKNANAFPTERGTTATTLRPS